MYIQFIVNPDEFKAVINQNKLVVINFYGMWCGPSKAISPKFATLAQSHPDADFANVNVDQVFEVTSEYNISNTPTFLYFKNGQKVGEVVGAKLPEIEATLLRNL